MLHPKTRGVGLKQSPVYKFSVDAPHPNTVAATSRERPWGDKTKKGGQCWPTGSYIPTSPQKDMFDTYVLRRVYTYNHYHSASLTILYSGKAFADGPKLAGVSPPDAIALSSSTPTPSPTVAAAAKQQPVRNASYAAWNKRVCAINYEPNKQQFVPWCMYPDPTHVHTQS